MARVVLEIDTQLYRMLLAAAETSQISLEEECCRGLAASAVLNICRPCWPNCAPRMNSGAPIRGDYFFFAGAAFGQSDS